MAWQIIYKTESTIRRPIVKARVAFLLPNGQKQAIITYLRMHKGIRGRNGSLVQMDYSNGGYRDDRKTLLQYSLPLVNEVSKENGDDFIVPFIAGNWSTSTSQIPWRDNLAAAIRKAVGFDCDQVTESNLEDKNKELEAALQNKDLECYWSCWRDPFNKARFFYGPNGETLKIV